MPWHKNYDETQVLDRAMQAFWSRGYEATSMANLVTTTGINRGSIYAAFRNKHALFMGVLRRYDKIYRVEHLQRIADEYAPKDSIIAVFEIAAKRPTQLSNPCGCLLVNTALEMSPHDSEVGKFVDRSLQGVEMFFFSRIEAAQQDGSIPAGLDARNTAQALLGLFLGLRVLTRAKTRQATIDAITSQARMMLA